MPFDEDDDIEIKRKVSIKAPTKESIFDKMPKTPSKQEFEKRAGEANAKLNSYSERALEHTLAFKKIMDDKTIPLNKGVFVADLEKEVIGNLVNLAIDMNDDPLERHESMGSVGLIAFLFRLAISLKDRINELDYKLYVLEKKLTQYESNTKSLTDIDIKK